MPEHNILTEKNEINEVMGSTPPWMLRCGILLLVLTVGLLGTLSIMIQYPDVMEGQVEIRSAGDHYSVTATLPVYGSGRIKAGQAVYVSMDKYPREEFGELQGTIITSPVQGAGQDARVQITLNSGLKSSNGHTLDPGARASGHCTIVIGKAPLLAKLLPLKKR
jgi:hypothetical protein